MNVSVLSGDTSDIASTDDMRNIARPLATSSSADMGEAVSYVSILPRMNIVKVIICNRTRTSDFRWMATDIQRVRFIIQDDRNTWVGEEWVLCDSLRRIQWLAFSHHRFFVILCDYDNGSNHNQIENRTRVVSVSHKAVQMSDSHVLIVFAST